MSDHGCKIISFASGKGGVGKTLSTVNVAMTFACEGKKVIILDGDFGVANVDVVLGLQPRHNIEDVLEGKVHIDQVVLDGPFGIKVIPSSSGLTRLDRMSFTQKVSLLDNIGSLKANSDYLLIDSGAGVSSGVLHLNSLAQEVIIVTTPEPHALTDAYAFAKVMSQKYQTKEFKIIVNQTTNIDEGLKIYRGLSDVMLRFLNVRAKFLGSVPIDSTVRKNLMSGTSINSNTTKTFAGQAWKNVALNLLEITSNIGERPTDQVWSRLLFGADRSRAAQYA